MGKRDLLCEIGCEDSVVFENPSYEDAIIGTTDDGRVVYSYDKMVEFLMSEDGMTEEEAIEFIDFNTLRALPYFPHGPVVLMNEHIFGDDGD